jgi:RHS repeat-associated protein
LGSLQWTSGTYTYDGAGNIVSIGSDNYLYDGVQRLKQSSTQGASETYTYDGFGNMKTRTSTAIPTPDPATNRYNGYSYNQIGAVTSDGTYTFSYDALGQPLSKEYNGDASTLEYYVYTPSDERIGVQRGTWWRWSVRDESGKVLRQYKSSSTNPAVASLWVEDFVWRDGLLLGSQRPPEMGGRRHFHLDHLGSPRLITSDNGQMVSYHDYYPFGDEHSPVPQEVPHGFDREEPMKFTGQERDYAGGMGGEDGHAIDDMHARDYAPAVGRFWSVDTDLETDIAMHKPQRWNRYAYVTNSPMILSDPTGRAGALYTVNENFLQDLFSYYKPEVEHLEAAGEDLKDIPVVVPAVKIVGEEAGMKVGPVQIGVKADISATADLKERQLGLETTIEGTAGIKNTKYGGSAGVQTTVPIVKDGKVLPQGLKGDIQVTRGRISGAGTTTQITVTLGSILRLEVGVDYGKAAGAIAHTYLAGAGLLNKMLFLPF